MNIEIPITSQSAESSANSSRDPRFDSLIGNLEVLRSSSSDSIDNIRKEVAKHAANKESSELLQDILVQHTDNMNNYIAILLDKVSNMIDSSSSERTCVEAQIELIKKRLDYLEYVQQNSTAPTPAYPAFTPNTPIVIYNSKSTHENS